MALQTFSPPQSPSQPLSRSTQARAKRAQFGDGYSQRAGDGLNAIGSTVDLKWEVLTKTDADAIEAFFEARKGYEAFLYTMPHSTSEKKWIVTAWNRDTRLEDIQSISATFEQVFDL